MSGFVYRIEFCSEYSLSQNTLDPVTSFRYKRGTTIGSIRFDLNDKPLSWMGRGPRHNTIHICCITTILRFMVPIDRMLVGSVCINEKPIQASILGCDGYQSLPPHHNRTYLPLAAGLQDDVVIASRETSGANLCQMLTKYIWSIGE
ncbi:MAG: hypothetical protein CL946_00960 [Ectothiorhodospiraceae bacterium]|nr:hypothetical protein [Ectothiorhodospiraceae bacterium]